MKNLLFLLLFLPFCSQAQVPEPHMLSLQVIGGNGGDNISSNTTMTPDGGFILGIGTNSSSGSITDSFCSFPTNRALFIKINANDGKFEWSKCRKNTWGDTGYIYMFESAGNQYVLGGAANSGNKWVIQKESASGNVLWVKAYGGSGSQMLYSMMPTDDGGYILFGSAYGSDGDIGFHYGSASTRDFWVLKVDADGEKVWSKVYGGTAEDIGASVLPAPGGGCYIVGSTTSVDYQCIDNNGGSDVFIARLNASGDMLWHRCLGGSGSDGGEVEGCRATLDGKGGVLVAAKTGSADGNVSHKINLVGNNFWLLNIDSSGTLLWDNCYGGGGAEIPTSICKATDGSIWIIGQSRLTGGQVNTAYGAASDAYVVHTDDEGNFLNAKVLGSTGQDAGYMIIPLSNGWVMAGGYFGAGNGVFPNEFQGGSIDVFLVKFTNWTNEIHNICNNESISVYPNPAYNLVNVHVKNDNKYAVIVNDITGKMVYSNNIVSNLQIPLSGWHSGMYLMQIVDQDGNRSVQKLVVK